MKEQDIFYYDSPLGPIQITGNDEAITAVSFKEEANGSSLTPASTHPPALLTQCAQQLQEYFEGKRTVFELPLAQPGTDFQQKVWGQLLTIPFGKTVSYMHMAKQLGDPKVIRAAAAANGKNNIAIIVPCHRVIGANQTLVGYAGGLWRKKWLLDLENTVVNGVRTLF
jgi:methylated-DNA-[protein]-cysteine S-methyltransferase